MLPYKFMMNDETNNLFIQFDDEKYKSVLAKVGHIQYNEQGEIEFDMELPEGKESFYDDENFIENIQSAVFDIVAKSVNSYWNEATQAILTDLESKVRKALNQYKIELPEDKTFLEILGEKGYIVNEDENDNNRLVAINHDKNIIYHFDTQDDLSMIRNVITGGHLIL